MVTVIVGRQIPGEESTVLTTCKLIGSPNKVIIDMPNENALVRALIPGEPKWANYLKGMSGN